MNFSDRLPKPKESVISRVTEHIAGTNRNFWKFHYQGLNYYVSAEGDIYAEDPFFDHKAKYDVDSGVLRNTVHELLSNAGVNNIPWTAKNINRI